MKSAAAQLPVHACGDPFSGEPDAGKSACPVRRGESGSHRKVSPPLLLYLPGSLIADQITLNNGDRISGQVIKKDGDKLTVKSALFGEVSIPWSAVS